MGEHEAWIRTILATAGTALGPKVIEKLEALGRKDPLGVAEDEFKRTASLVDEAEFKLYKKLFPRKSRSRRLALIGLRLRQVQGDLEAVNNLLNIVKQAYMTDGRHAAQAVQCGGLKYLLDELSTRDHPDSEIKRVANQFLEKIDEYALFVTDLDSAETVTSRVGHRLTQLEPPFFLVAGSGTAMEKAKKVVDSLEPTQFQSYQVVRHQNDPSSFMALFIRL